MTRKSHQRKCKPHTKQCQADKPVGRNRKARAYTTPKTSAYATQAVSSARLCRMVYLIGFMGAGKTTLARRMSKLFGVPFIDLDSYIAHVAHRGSKEIIQEQGEAAFRALETKCLAEVSKQEPALVALGGGAVVSEENRRIIKETGHVIYLLANPDDALKKISRIESRPLFGDIEQAWALYKTRAPLYKQASDHKIYVGCRPLKSIVGECRAHLLDEGILIMDEAGLAGGRDEEGFKDC